MSERCVECRGAGAIPVPGDCPECGGRGVRPDPHRKVDGHPVYTICQDCEGAGRIDYSECPTCTAKEQPARSVKNPAA